ncbi:MAG: hypothetical protein AAF467_27920 [Actinomycetota bacterium]
MLTHHPSGDETHPTLNTDAGTTRSGPTVISAVAVLIVAGAGPAVLAVVTVWLLVYANLEPWTQVMVCAAVPTVIGAVGLTAGWLLVRGGR